MGQTDTPAAQVALQYFALLVPVESGSFPACFDSDTSPQRRAGAGSPRQLLHVRSCVDLAAFAHAHEDPAALAPTAARRLFTTADIAPTMIGPCGVGTGSAVDHSMVAAYPHRLLGLPQKCPVFEVKHA